MVKHTCDVCDSPALTKSTVEQAVRLATRFNGILVRMTFNKPDRVAYGVGAHVHLCDTCRRAAAELFIGMLRADPTPPDVDGK